ncbi:MAG: hypothetical protein ABH838_01500 [Actinomycetota bacterium]
MKEQNEAPGNEPAGEKKKGLSEGAKSFLKAWVFVIVLVLLIFGGVSLSRYLRNSTQTIETNQDAKDKTTTTPKDIPLYEGAVATVHRVAGDVEFYEYDLPQGSVSTVHAFYEQNMKARDWKRLPGSNDYEDKYSRTDGRTATIFLSYKAGKVHLKMTVKYPQ